jgi:NADH-quinone oxidoreductase subunit M
MNFPFLSVITLIPAVAGAIILAIPADRKNEVRVFALSAGIFATILSLFVYFGYNTAGEQYQFIEKVPWVEALGIDYHLGVNGMSAPLMLLTAIVMLTGVLISWGIEDRPREFFAFLFILATGVFGVFASLDLFTLFFFYEIAVFPMYLLIAIWGWVKTREYAAMKLTLYLFVGSVFALIGALAMYFQAHATLGVYTFDMLKMEAANFPRDFQILWFPIVFFGFAVLGGIFPFHNWSPVGHVAAPTAVSMFHAGVLMKLGAFAALRVGVILLPQGAAFHAPWIILLTLVNVVYGAYIAMTQDDLKYMIGYSSVSHMGLVSMGVATLNHQGLVGAGMQMFSHGVMTALFFACVGMMYDRTHTRQISELGGMHKKFPWVTVAFIIGGFTSMGMPGLSGFAAEFPIFVGVWNGKALDVVGYPAFFANFFSQPWFFPAIAVISAIAIVITAAYILRAVQRVFFGPMPHHFEHPDEHHEPLTDIRTVDRIAIIILCSFMIIIGVYPDIMAKLVDSGVLPILKLLGVA